MINHDQLQLFKAWKDDIIHTRKSTDYVTFVDWNIAIQLLIKPVSSPSQAHT